MHGYLTMKKMKLVESIHDFMREEKGASDMVAVMLLILVAVAAAWVFRERIMQLVNELFDSINTSGLGDKP